MLRDLPREQRVIIVALALLGGVGCGLAAGGYMGVIIFLIPVALFTLTFVRPLAGVALLAVALPTYSLVLESIQMSPFRAMGILVFAGWVLGALVRREALPRMRAMDVCAFLYLTAVIISAVVNGSAADVIETDVQLVILYLMVIGVARSHRAARVVLFAVLAGQLLNGFVAAYQRHTDNYAFLNPTVDLDAWGKRAPGLSDPNETGIKLGYTMPVGFTLIALSSTPALLRVGLGVASCVGLFGLFGTASRSGIFTLIVGVVLWTIMWVLSAPSAPIASGRPNAPPVAAPTRTRHLAIAALLFLVLGGFYMKVVRNQLSEDFERRWNKTMTQDTANPLDDRALTGRVGIWREALRRFAEKTLFGSGPKVGVKAAEGQFEHAAHNTVLQVAVQEGLAGSVPFHLVFWLGLLGLWRTRTALRSAGQELDALFVSSLLVLVPALMFGALAGTLAHDKDVWFILGLISALTQASMLGSQGTRETSTERALPTRKLREAGPAAL